MKFRLTYEGSLKAPTKNDKRTDHKHEIRKQFHPQLKRFWDQHPYLKSANYTKRQEGPTGFNLRQYLMKQHFKFGYNFIPLVTTELSLTCSIDILFLRPSMPGQLINSGDLDNRLKTLFDALKMPTYTHELGKYDKPEDNELPFYCLLEDDKLISHISVETDVLLEAITSKDDDINQNDTRLIITVTLTPFDIGWDNIAFVG